MKNYSTKKRVVRQFRDTVSDKLTLALLDYQTVVGEKEFQTCIKKATRTFTRDFSKAIVNRMSI
jgi:hypothetical protein